MKRAVTTFYETMLAAALALRRLRRREDERRSPRPS